MEKTDIFVYDMGKSLYINLTNRCQNDCEFCIRRNNNGVGGHYLWIKKEPSAQEVIAQLGVISDYTEIVFCGFGEPLLRLDVLKEIAAYVKEIGKQVRVNTNGQANLFYGCDITPQLEGLVDTISISLNATNAYDYDRICHPQFGEQAFEGLQEFARCASEYVPEIVFTIFDSMSDEDIEACRQIAEGAGGTLRIRHFIE